MKMEVTALFGRFVWRGVNIDDATIHPSRGSRINPTVKQDSTTGEFRFRIVKLGNCVSVEKMFGKPNFKHKITRFQRYPCKKSKK